MIWALLLAFQAKHFLADYPLQRPYMLGKFKPWPECAKPLAAHAGVHALGTAIIAACAGASPILCYWLALLDFAAHGAMDFVKANPSLLGRFKAIGAYEYKGVVEMASWVSSSNAEMRNASKVGVSRLRSNTFFWWALGFDQAVHHLTHYLIIWLLLR